MKKKYLLIILILLVHLYFLGNLAFTAWPEMFSYAYLKNNGFYLYKDMIYPYPPLLTGLLSIWYKIFGYGLFSLKSFTWILIVITDLLVFAVSKKITKDEKVSFVALAIYVFLQPFMEGNMLWFDLALVPFVLGGIYYAVKSIEEERFDWVNTTMAGYFFVLAALVKQTAGIYLLIYLTFLLFKKKPLRYVKFTLIAPLFIGSILILKLASRGQLNWFLDWVFIYPFTFWSKFPGYVQMSLSKSQLFIMFFVSVPFLFMLPKIVKKRGTSLDNLVFAFFAASLLSIYPRFSFFHFQMGISLVAICWAMYLKGVKKLKLIPLLVLVALIPYLHKPVVASGWGKPARFFSSYETALSKNLVEQDVKGRVYSLGVHSGLYSITNTIPPKPWTDNFGWYLEVPGVQDDIIKRWEENPPQFIVWNSPRKGNWFDLATYQPKKITDWIKSNYNDDGEVIEGVSIWQRKY